MLAVDRFIAAPASVVWNVFVDLDAWPQWGPTVGAAWLDPPHTSLELGATGGVRTSPGRHWAWKVAGIPATHHRVEPADGGARASFAAPLWAAAYLSVCAIALRRIEAIANARR
jgi:hypothetical protein